MEPTTKSIDRSAAMRIGVAHDSSRHGSWVSVANQIPESLDYEEQENQLLEDARSAEFEKGGASSVWKQWIVIVGIGVLTAAVAFGINEGIGALVHLKSKAIAHFMTGNLFWQPFALFAGINLAYVLVAASLVVFLEPLAKGSGISEVKCYLNGIRLPRVVRFRTLLCKAIGIMFSVASGLPCGKEGPMIHSGAVIASGLSTGKSTMLRFDTGLCKEFRSDRFRRFFVTAGASAGVAAAFGAPIGGLLFAVEEVASFWKIEMTVMIFCCSAVTPFVLQILQNPSSFGSGAIRGLIDFGMIEGSYRTVDIPFIALLGICGGLLGSAFIGMNLRVAKWRRAHVTSKMRQMIEVTVVSLTVSTVLMLLVLRGFTCVPFSENQLNLNSTVVFQTYGCPPGEFNDMATYFLPTMEESISLLIHSELKFSISSLLKQFVPYFFLTMINFGTMVPSGLFLPTLALGANFGHLYAQLWNLVLPPQSALDPAAYALFGATAILAGVVRTTISVIVIVMEATNNISFFYPLAIITVCAKFVGDRFNVGIYDAYIHFNRIPVLSTELDKRELCLLCAKDVVNTRVVRTPVVTRVGNLITLLKAFPFNNVLVVESNDGERLFKGLLLRRTAVLLVMKKAWIRPLTHDEFVQGAREREILCLKKYKTFDSVSQEDKDMMIDLLPYIDQWPHMFTLSAPLARIHRTFRELGLRYIVIVDGKGHASGVIARKQLCLLEFVDSALLPEERGFGFRLRKSFQGGDLPHSQQISFVPEVYSLQQDLLDEIGASAYELDDEEWQDAHREGVN